MLRSVSKSIDQILQQSPVLSDANLLVLLVCRPTAYVNLDGDVLEESKVWDKWWDRDNFYEDEDLDDLKQAAHFARQLD